MIRLSYVLGVLAMAASGCVLALCVDPWLKSDSQTWQSLGHEGAVQVFMRSHTGGSSEGEGRQISPLVLQAGAFASYLNPTPVVRKELVTPQKVPKPAAPDVRPIDTSPKFTVLGTSYFTDEPKRSMALIREPGAVDGRWVKEGTQIGHITIHEVRFESVVCMAGGRLWEIEVEETGPATVLVGSDSLPQPNPRTALNAPLPTPSVETAKRPTSGTGRTVGGIKTAALD
jgi:hypothetical protein